MNDFLRKGDFWSGLVLAALGAYIVSAASGWTYVGEDGPGAGFFPLWYGGAMVVLSLLLVAGAVMKPSAGTRKAKNPWPELRRALTCWVAFAACIALMRVTGFVIAFALLTWFIAAVMFRKPAKVALPLAVGGAAVFWALFSWALDINLPAGLFA